MSKHRTHRTIWNRLLSGVLCLALALGLLPAAGLVQTAGAASWADPYGQRLVEWGIMQPASDLRLDSTITRAEFVAMCNRAFGYHRLGSTPFVDVPASAWYAQDVNIAYNAGYFQGTATNIASPNGTLTREQAAVLLVRNMMIQEAVGESLSFTDSRDLSDWSRGLVAAAAEEGVINGNDDGSFKPFNNITRGEVAAMLVRAVGNPISAAGSYEMGDVYGNVTISSSNVTLRNTTILGNLYITGGVDLGNVLLENVTVLGRIVVSGGGESHAGQSSVVLRNVAADELVVDSILNQFTTVSAYGITDIPVTHVRSDLYLEDASWPGYGLKYIELDGDPGAELQLAGTIKEVVNKTPSSTLRLAQGTAEKITIDEYAVNSELILDINTRVDELNLDVATLVRGKGDITHLIIGAAGSVVEILPEKVTIRPGITAVIDGEEVDSNGAAELSSEPRLMAGYPRVANLTPTQAEAQFSANKQGTIYYAVSEVADGSVSEEDLITNPAYGGIIYEGQAGSVDADSKTVYSRDITRLLPDGSYYLSAIMEDGRGLRSPLKVISFTTPDDTVPEFLNGRISRETCDVVQLTGMANKSCTLYWVLLEDGAAAPTAQNFKSGSFGGNYGSGSLNVAKNVPVSITVNTMRLLEDTKYVLYVWLNDFNGAQSSQVYRFDVHTPDETAPIVTKMMQTGYGESDAEVTFAVNEAPSTLFWAVVTESNVSFITPDADMDSLSNQIKVVNGEKAGAAVSGSTPANTANVDTLITAAVLRGLDYETYKTHSFKMYYVARDAAGNYSTVGVLEIHTLDTDPPTAWLEFSDYMGENPKRPRANSDIMLVFSEQVKGGASATETFLELYERVEAFAKQLEADPQNTTIQYNLTAAREEMAKELAAHIQLYYVPSTGRPVQVTEGIPSFGDGDGNEDWINFRNATLELRSDGCMVITLPGSGDNQAINLKSGATYQFQILGVFDDAFTPNGMAGDHGQDASGKDIADTSGNFVTGLYFTTVYAQVELYENTDYTEIEIGGRTIPLDICVDVIPLSTSNIADTEYWDMIMWLSTYADFDIYRKVDYPSGDAHEDEDWTLLASVSYDGPNSEEAVSWNMSRTDLPESDRTERVTAGLVQDATYTYGIHFTKVTGNSVRESWGDTVTMTFSLVAGTKGNVSNLSGAMGSNGGSYDKAVSESKVSEIGVVYTSTGTETKLTLEKRFTDTQVPSFQSGYPTFTKDSGSITMNVSLDRPGRVYYVVAPSPDADRKTPLASINPSTGSNAITGGKDGSGLKKDGNKTYIPEDGVDRKNNWDSIWFVSGDGGTEEKPIAAAYSSPTSQQITNGRNEYARYEDFKTGYADIGVAEPITISGLRPETEYYIYIVLQGGGKADNIVQIYRQTTDQVEVPVVTITGSTSSATMTSTQDCWLSFALVEYNYLPESVTKKVSTTPADDDKDDDDDAGTEDKAAAADDDDDGTEMILELMRNRTGSNTGGKSQFDVVGTPADKYAVAQYVLGNVAGTGNQMEHWTLPDGNTYDGVTFSKDVPIRANEPLTWDFSAYMTNMDSEYVVLVAARHFYGGTTGEDYGFAALRGLYVQDTVPPAFTGGDQNKDGYVTCSISGATKLDGETPVSKNTWSDNPENYLYSGSVTITFSKDIYCNIKMIRYTLKNETSGKEVEQDDKTNTIGIITAMSGSTSKITKATVNGRTVTLNFEGLAIFDTFVFFGAGKIANSSNFAAGEALTLTFNPALKGEETMKSTFTKDLLTPGFYVSWKA